MENRKPAGALLGALDAEELQLDALLYVCAHHIYIYIYIYKYIYIYIYVLSFSHLFV